MYFAHGGSRHVLCIGNVAIKMARFDTLFHQIRRYFYWRKNGGAGRRIKAEYGSPLFLISQMLFGGIWSNIEERRFSKRHRNLPIAPTYFSFLGFVNIQARGKPIAAEELDVCPFREHAYRKIDLRKAEHFGWINGRICLLDYGSPAVNGLIAPHQPSRSRWATT